MILLNGVVILQAVIALDPNGRVKVIEHDEEDVVAVRFADTRQRARREPMVPSRQALARCRDGISQEAIAKELGVSPGSISQMVSAAKVEEEFEDLAILIINRSRLLRRWWEDVHTTRERLRKADENEPERSTPRMDRFTTAISGLIAANKPVSSEHVRKVLGINVPRSEPKRRNRVLGKPVRRQGLKVQINVDKERQGDPSSTSPRNIRARNSTRHWRHCWLS